MTLIIIESFSNRFGNKKNFKFFSSATIRFVFPGREKLLNFVLRSCDQNCISLEIYRLTYLARYRMRERNRKKPAGHDESKSLFCLA